MNNKIDFYQNEDCATYRVKMLTEKGSILRATLEAMHVKLDFKPFQYCLLKGTDDVFRAYSVVYSANQERQLDIMIRLSKRNQIIKSHLGKGQLIHLKGPFGERVTETSLSRSTVFLAEGMGVVAFLSALSFNYKMNKPQLFWLRDNKDDIDGFINLKNCYPIVLANQAEKLLSALREFICHHKEVNLYIATSAELENKIKQDFLNELKEGKLFIYSNNTR